MSFVTHAQNGEDVVLWRALGGIRNGFWIDVGANDPDIDSVTRVFSDAGWTGINIEPMAPAFERLVERRPNDINLCVAIEDHEGESVYFAVGESLGLSTGDPRQVDEYRKSGLAIEEVSVMTRTLASVWAEFVTGDVHFLKIDAEGAEARVLAGADLGRNRPWVVLVEAVMPVVLGDVPRGDPHSIPIPSRTHETWEHHLTENGYEFVLFDGLNRFYVASEHSEQLTPALSSPVSVLDGIESLSTRNVRAGYEELVDNLHDELLRHVDLLESVNRESDLLRADISVLNSERSALMDRFDRMSEERTRLRQQIDSLSAERDRITRELELTHQTLSWRITSPLRRIRRSSRRR